MNGLGKRVEALEEIARQARRDRAEAEVLSNASRKRWRLSPADI